MISLMPTMEGTCSVCYGDNHPDLRKNVDLYSLVEVLDNYPQLSKLIPKDWEDYYCCKDCFEGEIIGRVLFDAVDAKLWFSSMAEARKLKDKWLTKRLWDIVDVVCPGCGASWEHSKHIDNDITETAVLRTYAQVKNVPKFLHDKFRVCLKCCEKMELKCIKEIKNEDVPLFMHKFFTPKGEKAYEARAKTCGEV